MKLAVAIVAALAVSGCSEDRTSSLPLTPSLMPGNGTGVVARVLDQNGSCIVGATIQVVAGQATGRSLTQTHPCGYWDYGYELIFSNLALGTELTLRATASGYTTVEATVVPSSTTVDLTLTRAPATD